MIASRPGTSFQSAPSRKELMATGGLVKTGQLFIYTYSQEELLDKGVIKSELKKKQFSKCY